jgi:hypothetical protein
MSTESKSPTDVSHPQVGVPASDAGAPEMPTNGAPGNPREAQLRARIGQLEAALADTARCLDDAEGRAAELLAARARIRELEDELASTTQRLEVIVTSKSWRLTTPLRRAVARSRRAAAR